MITTIEPKQVVSDLNDLMQLDYDAITAYESAIERLESAIYRAKLMEFLSDHKRHVDELANAVRSAGGEPATDGDAKAWLTKGRVVLADIVGDDESILKAMKVNEDQTNAKYEEALEAGYLEPIKAMLRRGLADERRHREWLVATIDAL